ncbi:MAG TPA: hypothetical protein DCR93_24745 [Cytophagales bacterium]|nr:hypothetical protein [Cytophagales bacterium]
MQQKWMVLGLLCLLSISAQAQHSVTVSPLTGTGNVNIPLWTMTDHDLSVPLSINYAATGIKVEQPSGFVGLGWSLVGPGSIMREVRGLPDDLVPNGTGETREGWLYSTVGSQVESLAGQTQQQGVNINLSDCNGEAQVGATVKNDFWDVNRDSEPDLFRFFIPGYSGTFFFDNDGAIQVSPYQNLTISYANNPNGSIAWFKITTPAGEDYWFNAQSTVKRQAVKNPDVQAVKYFAREYELYQELVTYTSSWQVTKVESATSMAEINFTYKTNTTLRSVPKEVVVEKSDGTEVKVTEYATVIEETALRLHTAATSQFQYVWLDYSGVGDDFLLTDVQVYDRSDAANQEYVFNRVFNLQYLNLSTVTQNDQKYHKNFLISLTESAGCEVRNPYQFYYWGVDIENRSTLMADPSENDNYTDVWGYFNNQAHGGEGAPQVWVYPNESQENRFRTSRMVNYVAGTEVEIQGAARQTNPAVIMTGTLDRVVTPAGGSFIFTYEPHRYWDSYAQAEIVGGGIRVKQLSIRDGLGGNNTMVESYTYQNNGASSGRVMFPPQFVVPTANYKNPETETFTTANDVVNDASITNHWNRLAVRTLTNQAPEGVFGGSNVAYTHITKAMAGAGSITFEYDVPATFGDGVYNNGEWAPVATLPLRETDLCNPTQNMGTHTFGVYTYPYLPFPNFDYARGLPLKQVMKDEAGNLVQETEYLYQELLKEEFRGESTGVFLEKDVGAADKSVYRILPYSLYSGTRKSLLEITERLYAPDDPAVYSESTTRYEHNSNKHDFLTDMLATQSNGDRLRTHYRYPQDYVIGNTQANTADVAGIKGLVTKHVLQTNLESFTWLTPYNESQEVLIDASYSQHHLVSFGTETRVLPAASYSLETATPLASFSGATVGWGSQYQEVFLPAEYRQVEAVTEYTNTGNLRELYDPLNQQYYSTHWGYDDKYPVVLVQKGRTDEVVYSDFETTTGIEWDMQPGTGQVSTQEAFTGSHSYLASASGTTFAQATLPWRDAHTVYVSAYVKTDVQSDLTVLLNNPVGNYNFETRTQTIDPTGGTWQYVEFAIDIHPVPVVIENFVVRFQGFEGYIDNLLFHPARAEVTWSTYNESFGVTAQSTGNGKTQFVEYDHLGRERRIRDHLGNIIRQTTYEDVNQSSVPSADFDVGLITAFEPATFQVSNYCFPEATYTWDVGVPGVAPIVTPGPTLEYTFDGSSNTRTVTLTVTHPDYPSIPPVSKTLDIRLPNVGVSFCVDGPTELVIRANIVTEVKSYEDCNGAGDYAPGTLTNRTTFVADLDFSAGCTPDIVTLQWEISRKNNAGVFLQWNTLATATGPVGNVLKEVTAEESHDYKIRLKVLSAEGTTCTRSGLSAERLIEIENHPGLLE